MVDGYPYDGSADHKLAAAIPVSAFRCASFTVANSPKPRSTPRTLRPAATTWRSGRRIWRVSTARKRGRSAARITPTACCIRARRPASATSRTAVPTPSSSRRPEKRTTPPGSTAPRRRWSDCWKAPGPSSCSIRPASTTSRTRVRRPRSIGAMKRLARQDTISRPTYTRAARTGSTAPAATTPAWSTTCSATRSVRSVSDGIDPTLYMHLITRDGGEPVNDFHQQ